MAYATEVLADSPYSYWKVDETSGTAAADSSGNSRSGTYFTSPNLNASALVLGSTACVDLQGTGQSVFRNHEAAMNSATVTLEAWIRLDGAPGSNGYHCVFAKESYTAAANTRSFGCYVNHSTGEIFWNGQLTSGSAFTATSAAGVIALNTTYHVVATWDGTIACLYVNGALVASHVITGTLRNSSYALQFGKDSSGTGRSLNGRMDELAFYTSALSLTRVQTHFAEGAGGAFSTATLTLSANGGASGPGSGSASLSLSAVGGVTAPAAGAAQITFSATGDTVAPGEGAGAAALSLSASGGAVGGGAGSAQLDLSAAGSAALGAAGTAQIEFDASGDAEIVFEGDTSNVFNGLDLGGAGDVEITVPVIEPPYTPDLAAALFDKAIAFAEPELVKGRPS